MLRGISEDRFSWLRLEFLDKEKTLASLSKLVCASIPEKTPILTSSLMALGLGWCPHHMPFPTLYTSTPSPPHLKILATPLAAQATKGIYTFEHAQVQGGVAEHEHDHGEQEAGGPHAQAQRPLPLHVRLPEIQGRYRRKRLAEICIPLYTQPQPQTARQAWYKCKTNSAKARRSRHQSTLRLTSWAERRGSRLACSSDSR